VARLAYSLPLALPALHLFWRKSFYNEWLPNTYFAKHLGAWPEAGIRYLVSYVLEYGLWFWALLVLVVLLCWLRDLARKVERRDLWNADMMVRIGIIGCVVVHLGYYTFVIGGDHFEYRVYSYTAPLVLLTTVWLINRLVENRGWKKTWAIFVPLVVVVLALPIPWTHWSKAQSLTSRNQTFQMVIPLAQSFPIGTRWYVQSFDTLQRWLIGDHAIGIRHQEHKVFLEYQRAIYPRTRLLESESLDEHNVFRVPTVGVPSWILARAHLIDILGLNDYVTARLAVSPTKSRRMAHDRVSPHAYVACFKPNLIVRSVGLVNMGVDDLSNWESPGFGIVPRTSPLTSLNIKECERRWRQQIRTSL